LVVCAVYVNDVIIEALSKLNIKDSKELSDNEMIELFPKIKKIVKFACLVYTPAEYNAFIKKYNNTHILKAYMHDACIKKLVKEIANNEITAVIDQFVNEEKYYSYFDKMNIAPYKNIIFETKAENKYIAVACASIIARVAFLKQISTMRKDTSINFPLGSSNKNIANYAKDICKKYGKEQLSNYVKIDFKTTEKVIN
jgi:ribonuclease HIII